MIGHGDYAFVIDQTGHMRQELSFDTGPGTPGHQVVVRGRADRRRPPAAGALMRPPARSAVAARGAGSRGADRGLRQRGTRRAGPAAEAPPARRAVPGHLPGHRRRHLGRRGHGRLGRLAQQLLAAVHAPGRAAPGGSWSPRPAPPTTAAWSWPAPGRSLIAAFRPSQYLTYTPLTATTRRRPGVVIDRPARRGPRQRSRTPWPRHRAAGACSPCSPTAPPSWPHPATPAGTRSPPSGPSPPRQPAGRCGLEALTAAAYTPSGVPLLAGDMLPAGYRRHLRRRRRDLAGSRTRDTRRAGPPARSPCCGSPDREPDVALLAAGSGRAASLLAAWSADNGRHWALSPALPLGGAGPGLSILRTRRDGRRASRRPAAPT